MVRKLQNFRVKIDGNGEVFYPGQQVSGVVIVVYVDQPMKLDQIKVKLEGLSYCYIDELVGDESGCETIYHCESQTLVNLQEILFRGSSTEKQPSGRRTYPFTFRLPSPLPSSFEGKKGHVRYYIEATVCRKSGRKDHVIRNPFTVNEIIDINLPQYSTAPHGTTRKRIGLIGCLCCVVGCVNMRASLNRSGYCPGEQIVLNASCENNSTRGMLCMRATLVQTFVIVLNRKRKRSQEQLHILMAGGFG
ncbi:arrestin domain-containing 3-like [Paramuricea clavata]|uniref:Arrestin domain-containing 3-like n=1 Tax=Paramuricea clavata TaxID=317549 RepID=A0A6S7KIA5_PARCT|nr:arrestin domain-containing 3-like [Paramuricea clavata]